MARPGLSVEEKQSIEDAVRCTDIGRAVEIANQLTWLPFTKRVESNRIGWIPLASEAEVNALLSCRPNIFKKFPEDIIAPLRLAAVMAELLGPEYRESE